MQVVSTVAQVQAFSAQLWREGARLALVPTMGFLHPGHLSLIREGALRAEVVAASIFVNPTQFGPKEDLSRYPRDLEGDLAKCEAAGAHLVFAPPPQQLYPAGYQSFVNVEAVSQGLDGDSRPGHFRGVATVVTKLLAMFRPQVALFGEKDYQQLQVISALARDLDLGVEIVGMPTVREADGLAMSSRNSYLTPDERRRALSLSRGLRAAQRLVASGELRAQALCERIRSELLAAQVREDYVAVVDAQTMRPLEVLASGTPARALLAGYLGTTRLIDNLPLFP